MKPIFATIISAIFIILIIEFVAAIIFMALGVKSFDIGFPPLLEATFTKN